MSKPTYILQENEKNSDAKKSTSSEYDQESLKLDSHNLPLVPQPSRFRDDPLNWPRWLKWAVLLQVSFLALLAVFNASVINPSLVILGKALHVDTKKAAYSTTTGIIVGGVSSFLWTPLSNVYGRRPIILMAVAVTIIGAIGSAVSPTFAILLGTRAINGFGFGGMMSIGTSVVNDMFFLHERGEKTGIYSIFVTNGAHFGFLCGGYLAQARGWQWDYWLPAIIDIFVFIVALVLLPETLFSRSAEFLDTRSHERTYFQMLWDFKGNMIPQRTLHLDDFMHSFHMLKYPSITFSFWYYTWAWTFVNVLPAVTLANLYSKIYKMKSGPIGLSLGISLISGSILGELSAGKMSDYIMRRLAQRNGVRKPEHRLYLSTLSALFMPLGMIIFGVCLQNKAHFTVPLVGLAISEFGLQIASTCLYSYVSDCYKPQTPESGNLFNFGRGLSFTIGYYALPYAGKVGYAWAWSTFGIIQLVFFIPIGALMIWGERWRKQISPPTFHQYM